MKQWASWLGVVGIWLAASACGKSEALFKLGSFSLTERSGRTVTHRDLENKVWVANFIFTRCSGPCPKLSDAMARLQESLPKEILLVSITVDPGYDTPQVLSEYADRFKASKDRWLFLTGPKEEVYRLITKGFHLPVQETPGDPGNAFMHSQKFVLIDRHGTIRDERSYSDGNHEKDVNKLIRDVRKRFFVSYLPAVNAMLNATSAVLLALGLFMIKRRRITAHKMCMITAFIVSIAFLISYLYYHYHHGATPFTGTGWVRAVYFAILISHTVLAASVPVLAIITLIRAMKGQFEKHKRIARWTFPIWMYVSVTGVVVYVMLYHLNSF